MFPRLDAHAHFFYPGFVERLPQSCRRQTPDEITLYRAFAEQHEIRQVLAVGYEGEPWAIGNNGYLATIAEQHTWVRPLAFVTMPSNLTVTGLQQWQAQHFVGISFYIFSTEQAATLSDVRGEVWQWLADHAWLISVNSTGDYWISWHPILDKYPQLRLLIAHLGIPPVVPAAPSLEQARSSIASVLHLADYPLTHVKFSGFYAIASPGYDYPHSAAWPYAQAIHQRFGTERILWASDFSPALEFVSFPQTVEVLRAMLWFNESDLAAIYHDNLSGLLASVEERNSRP
jgi:L-fuconolactonase